MRRRPPTNASGHVTARRAHFSLTLGEVGAEQTGSAQKPCAGRADVARTRPERSRMGPSPAKKPALSAVDGLVSGQVFRRTD